MNVRDILKQLHDDPLCPLLKAMQPEDSYALVRDEFALYAEAYEFFYLSLERLLKEMSLARRFRNGPYFALKYRIGYTSKEKKLTESYHSSKRYFDLDFFNFIILSRILLDRVISLSKYFLTAKQLPSFVSFNKHKKFFQKPEHRPYGKHEPYARYICDKTDWFERTLQAVRDKFVVHAQPGHVRISGLTDFGPSEVKMFIYIPRGASDKSFAQVAPIEVSVLRLIEGITDFLGFFNRYGLRALHR